MQCEGKEQRRVVCKYLTRFCLHCTILLFASVNIRRRKNKRRSLKFVYFNDDGTRSQKTLVAVSFLHVLTLLLQTVLNSQEVLQWAGSPSSGLSLYFILSGMRDGLHDAVGREIEKEWMQRSERIKAVKKTESWGVTEREPLKRYTFFFPSSHNDIIC